MNKQDISHQNHCKFSFCCYAIAILVFCLVIFSATLPNIFAEPNHMNMTNHASIINQLDGNDSTYSLNKNSTVNEKILEKMSMHGYDRKDSMFEEYKQKQISKAEKIMREICLECFDKRFDKIDNIFAYTFPEKTDRVKDPNMLFKMRTESNKAELTIQWILGSDYKSNQEKFLGHFSALVQLKPNPILSYNQVQ